MDPSFVPLEVVVVVQSCCNGSPGQARVSASKALLESTGMFDTFVFLRSVEKCCKTDLYSAIGRGSEMSHKLDRLEEAGLIWQEKYGRVTFLGLTNEGCEVADRIVAIQEIIGAARARTSSR